MDAPQISFGDMQKEEKMIVVGNVVESGHSRGKVYAAAGIVAAVMDNNGMNHMILIPSRRWKRRY